MKIILGAGLLTAMLTVNASATLYSYTFDSGFQNNGVVPDGSADGLADAHTLSGLRTIITDVQVTLNFSGGYNGDLYVYLAHGTESLVLLNRVGVGSGDPFGYSDAGMSVILANGGENGDIHSYGGTGIPTGTYAPDGRAIDPLSSPASFDAAGTEDFSVFNDLNPNGTWTLYFADMVGSEGNSSTLLSWSLDITAVPEPAHVALGIFGGVFVLVSVFRSAWVRSWFGSHFRRTT